MWLFHFFDFFFISLPDALAMLPVVSIRRYGGGGASGLKWCAEVVPVVVLFFDFFHFWVLSPSAPKSRFCLGFIVVADNSPGAL